ATMTPLQPLQHIAHPRALHSFPTRRSSDLSEQRDSPVEVSIDSLLNTMTLSEKIGQLFFIRARGYFKNTADEDYRRLLSRINDRSEEHTSELQSRFDLVCRLLLEKKKEHEI